MKKELRRQIIQARLDLSPEAAAEKSETIIQKLISLPAYQEAGTIMTYVAFNQEVETKGLIKYSLSQRKRVLVPVTVKKDRELIPSEVFHFPGDLQPGTWGILEPKPECFRPVSPSEIDMVVVPGVAFDKNGNRLGYGGGFYDRFLGKLPKTSRFVAIAFELQIKDNVYHQEHDQPVHWVITEEQVIKAK
ncbi:5-formyltetrahydrofolate cyclo-ligase [Metallumcola ferriviriculae]|uniref:5-formyltetrahydrofolate cyclo-ligase n=1 Tax=Metallumcola ferriviriculae TaxID=3039180 RepID=A0AAU0UTF1_9FIRM|nr:5-formyltetrahydrofolate cyclo-ligase [Desulfitibacteraceae bacterium MK1]